MQVIERTGRYTTTTLPFRWSPRSPRAPSFPPAFCVSTNIASYACFAVPARLRVGRHPNYVVGICAGLTRLVISRPRRMPLVALWEYERGRRVTSDSNIARRSLAGPTDASMPSLHVAAGCGIAVR